MDQDHPLIQVVVDHLVARATIEAALPADQGHLIPVEVVGRQVAALVEAGHPEAVAAAEGLRDHHHLEVVEAEVNLKIVTT